jgi:hypothetical protein
MGLLDDAIREHLDLKRRRGADPTEVERAEREALGPVRRNREASVASEGDDEPVAGGIAYDQADDEWADEDAGELAAGDEPAPAVEEPVFDESAFGESAFEEPGFDDELPPRRAVGAPGTETGEYDVEKALNADAESDEDVLEETPEFLQDTPDHDRLWFEQRPPKDFDFDG